MAKTGVTWSGGKKLTYVVENATKKAIRDAKTHVFFVMNNAVADTADYMQRFIEKVPSSLVPGKIGRVDTGYMRDSVDNTEVKKTGPRTWRVSAGWINDLEDYFLVQEWGGKAADGLRTGSGRRNISPMHMLTTGMLYMMNELEKNL